MKDILTFKNTKFSKYPTALSARVSSVEPKRLNHDFLHFKAGKTGATVVLVQVSSCIFPDSWSVCSVFFFRLFHVAFGLDAAQSSRDTSPSWDTSNAGRSELHKHITLPEIKTPGGKPLGCSDGPGNLGLCLSSRRINPQKLHSCRVLTSLRIKDRF